MKEIILPLLISFLFGGFIHIAAQVPQRTTAVAVNVSIYHMKTGEKLSHKEVDSLLKVYPGSALRQEFNKYGKVEKIFFDPDLIDRRVPRNPEDQTKLGEKLPPFVMRDTDGNTFDSDKLRGKFIVLQFQSAVTPPLYNPQKAEALNAEIEVVKKKTDLVSVFVTGASQSDIADNNALQDLNYHIIPNGHGFFERYTVIRMPSVLIIAPDGTLIERLSNPRNGQIAKSILNYIQE